MNTKGESQCLCKVRQTTDSFSPGVTPGCCDRASGTLQGCELWARAERGAAQQSPHCTGRSALRGPFSAAAARGKLPLPQQLQGSSPSTRSSTSGAAAGGKTQKMHRPGKSESPPAPQGVPRLDSELSPRLPRFLLHHARGQERGGCTSPSGNSCHSRVSAWRRTILWLHGTGGSALGSPCSARCQAAHGQTFPSPSGCRNPTRCHIWSHDPSRCST